MQTLLILIITLQLSNWILAMGKPQLGPLLPTIALVASLAMTKFVVIFCVAQSEITLVRRRRYVISNLTITHVLIATSFIP